MHIILAVLAAAGAVVFWLYRARMAGQVAQDLVGAAADVLNAARRLGFRRRANQHAVEGVDEPGLAIAAIGSAFIELDALPSASLQEALGAALRERLGVNQQRAEEMLILGRWLVSECQGPQPAIERVTKRLFRLDGTASLEPLMSVLKDVAQAGGGSLSTKQKDALEDIARHLRVR
jgi:hypothetical protein